jgi:FixJ family two-component response regulator/DNA-binding MarR family transcriptional regulator
MPDQPTVLIVDDETEIAAELAALIGRTGLAVVEAHDAAAAINAFAADQKIGVVVSDIRMPRRSGIDFVRGLRGIGNRGRMARIIFCTGYADVTVTVDALRLGAVEFLAKPIEPAELLAAVRKAADDYRQEMEGRVLDSAAARDLAQIVDQFKSFIMNGKAAPAAPGPAGDDDRLRKANHFISIRKLRDAHLPAAEFDEPLWFMMLDLYQSQITGQRVSISNLCLSSGIPQTTALRRIDDLVSRGLVHRVPDQNDRRRAFVELSEDGNARISRFLDSVVLDPAFP